MDSNGGTGNDIPNPGDSDDTEDDEDPDPHSELSGGELLMVSFAILGGKMDERDWYINDQIPTDVLLTKEPGSPVRFTAVDDFSVKLTESVANQIMMMYPHCNTNHLLELLLTMPVLMPTVLNAKDRSTFIPLPGKTASGGWDQGPLQEAINNLVAQLVWTSDADLPGKILFIYGSEDCTIHPLALKGNFNLVRNPTMSYHGTVPTVTMAPVPPPAPPAPPAPPGPPVPPANTGTSATGTGQGNMMLQALLTAVQGLVHSQTLAGERSDAMQLQFVQAQEAHLQAQRHQMVQMGNMVGNIGNTVGQAVARNINIPALPTTISMAPPVPAGVSHDPRVLGSLTNPRPVQIRDPNFNLQAYLNLYSTQPNDSKVRRIDAATHHIIQRGAIPQIAV